MTTIPHIASETTAIVKPVVRMPVGLVTSKMTGHTFKQDTRPISHCKRCGQFHDLEGPHLYDYNKTVDEDLTCHICLQPLVDPIDTKCGHTFCTSCIRNFLKIQNVCPVDRRHLNFKDVQPTSIMVKRWVVLFILRSGPNGNDLLIFRGG